MIESFILSNQFVIQSLNMQTRKHTRMKKIVIIKKNWTNLGKVLKCLNCFQVVRYHYLLKKWHFNKKPLKMGRACTQGDVINLLGRYRGWHPQSFSPTYARWQRGDMYWDTKRVEPFVCFMSEFCLIMLPTLQSCSVSLIQQISPLK